MREDFRFAVRLLRKSPGFTTSAMLTIALGIGASTTIFSQLNALFWQPLPVARPSELRLLVWSSRRPTFVAMPNVATGPHLPTGDTFGSFSYPAYVAMRDGARDTFNLACWADLGETRPVVMREVGFGAVHFVSGNYFDVLGVEPAIGRLLTPADDVVGTTAAVISYPFWQRTFGGDRSVLQRTLDLNGKAFSIVGVTRAGFFGVDASTTPDVMVPVNAIQLAAATTNPLGNPVIWAVCRVIGRLQQRTHDEQARRIAEEWLQDAIRASPPHDAYEPPRLWLIDASQGASTARDTVFTPIVVLFGVVMAVLLIACANIAGLLMVRTAARAREIATRMALGASRARLMRQLLTESMVLSGAGGVLGVGFAYVLGMSSPAFVGRLMPTLYGSDRHIGLAIVPDGRVLLFAIAITVATGLLAGTVPAWRATRVDLIASIKQGLSSGTARWFSGDRAMVALQAAMSLVLVFGAGLLLQTLSNLRTAPLGFDPEHLLYANVEPRTGGIPNNRRADYFVEAVTRVSSIPGVLASSATDDPPLAARGTVFLNGFSVPICVPGYVPRSPNETTATFAEVAPRFFETVRTRVVAGREFDWRDQSPEDAADSLKAIVNQAFVRTFFRGQEPVHQRFAVGTCAAARTTVDVVGVVADVKNTPRDAVAPKIYLPLGGSGMAATLVIRTAGEPHRLIPTIRRAIAELNIAVPTFNEVPAVDLREQRMRQERLVADLLLVFSAVALTLSAIGVYGMLSYLVVRRTRDIGIRIAIGASRGAIAWLVLAEAMTPMFVGIAIGTVLSLMAARAATSVFFGVSATDARTLIGAAALFTATALCAAMAPARRATAIDPLRALRFE